MSNELMIVLATASAAALTGGAVVAWLTTRPRDPDPELEGRHELQLVELRETALQCQQESRAAELQPARNQIAPRRIVIRDING